MQADFTQRQEAGNNGPAYDEESWQAIFDNAPEAGGGGLDDLAEGMEEGMSR
jgi:hypothetical protein